MNNVGRLLIDHVDIWVGEDSEIKAGRGRLPGDAAPYYGIKKIRELILNLAFSGKLSPQNIDDHGASEVVKKIHNGINPTLGRKKTEKNKYLLAVEESEQYFDLPKNWVWSRLGVTGKIFNGNSINENEKLEKFSNLSVGLPFIATKDVGYGDSSLNYQNGILIPYDQAGFKVAHAGSVVICSEGGSAGKKIGIADRDICFGNKLLANEVHDGVQSKWIFYLYQSNKFFQQFSSRMTGIIGGISISEFLNIPVPIAPIEEQLRIISKIEELMTLCDQLQNKFLLSSRDRGQLVDCLLQNLIANADSDTLNNNWAQLENLFDVLFVDLESIEKLKKTLIQLAVMGRLTVGASRKFLSEGNELPFSIPITWSVNKLQDLIDPARAISYGIIKLGVEPKDGGIPTLRCSDVKPGYIDLTAVRNVSREIESQYSRTRLSGGEVLLNIRGTLGGVALVDKSLAGFNIAREVAVLPIINTLSGEYLVYVIRSNYFWGEIMSSLRGIAYKGLNLGLLREFSIPLPPRDEQEKIVKVLNRMMSMCDGLIDLIASSSQLKREIADALVEQVLT